MKSLYPWFVRLVRPLTPVLFALLLVPLHGFCQPALPPVLLNWWSLDQPTWQDWLGDNPIGFTNLNVADGWSTDAGTALSVDTNVAAYLNLDMTNMFGEKNVNFAAGSVTFWFQPNWTSTTDGGDGIGNWGSLWTVGNWTSNASASCWTLVIDPNGTNLIFLAQSNGASQIVLTAPIDFDAGDFHNVCLTYSPTNCCLYLEGQPITNVSPIAYLPTPGDCAEYGMYIGSESTGIFQARGQFQNLEIYDAPLSTNDIAQDYAETSAIILNWGGSLPYTGGGFHFGDDIPDFPPTGGGSTNGGSGGGYLGPTYTVTSNYANYTNFWLVITNDPTNAYVSVESTLSNLTYVILTNSDLTTTNWGVWQTLLASNSTTPAPPITLTSNALFFNAILVWSTCTNYSPALPDWWTELYFNSTACVDPNANPSGDGIDNWDKYLMGLNPNTAYVSPLIISPPGGNYNSMPSISVLSLSGATIKYTTNGSTPSSSNGISVLSGVPLTNLPSGTFTLEAWESGLTSNVPVSAIYAIVPATPVLSVPSGLWAVGKTLQISCATTGATVYYTTSGVDPTTNSAQIQPTNIITLTTNQTIKAIACLGTNASPIASASYIVDGPPPNDNFSNAIVLSGSSGTFIGTTLASTIEPFEITNFDDEFYWSVNLGNSVWYKWVAPSNGSVFIDYSKSTIIPIIDYFYFPTNDGPNPLNLRSTNFYSYGNYSYIFQAVQDVAYYLCLNDDEAEGQFEISWEYVGPTAIPAFSLSPGTYLTPESVTVSCNDINAVMYYTTNGVDPTTTNTTITSGSTILISQTTTLKAIAWRAGLNESAVQTALYTINPSSTNPTLTASAPGLSPGTTNFASSLTVTLTCTNAGAVIYYTLDGSIPSSASASVSSGGTATVSNTALFKASAWVTNMNFSPTTTAIYAKNGVDTDGDGIPDDGELFIGSNPFLSDAGAINPNPFAHGLNNMQVYQNQSVLLADNYSTLNDGIPDWWMVQNGYSVTTSTNAIGANGQTLLASFIAGLSPNNPNSRPGQLPPIDFHMVHGPSNSMVLVLDTVTTNIISYLLYYTEADPTSPIYNQTAFEEFPAITAMSVSGQAAGRFFQMTNQLPAGNWIFTLQGKDSRGYFSTMSSNTFGRYLPSFWEGFSLPSQAEQGWSWSRYIGAPVPVVDYTNNNNIKEPLLAQILRGESDTWEPWIGRYPYAYVPSGCPVLFDSLVQFPTSEEQWGTLKFQYVPSRVTLPHYYPIDFASYFTSICSTSDGMLDCGDYYTNLYGDAGYSFPDLELAPLEDGLDSSSNQYFVMPTNTFNPTGLAYLSVTYRIGNDTPITLYPGESNVVPNTNFTFEVALDTETPTFQTINYYFDGKSYPIEQDNLIPVFSFPPLSQFPADMPPIDDFSYETYEGPLPISITNPVIITQVGRPVNLQGWSQLLAVRPNGTQLTNQSCWIDQDFAQAYLCDPVTGDVPRSTTETNYNGKYKIDTTNALTTGILSPNLNYPQDGALTHPGRSADFTPTQPGKVIVTTMSDTNGNYGEVTIYVIDMQVDANHDGIMDNRDLTSLNNPMQFWVNNDYDRGHTVDGSDWEQDDLNPGTDGFPSDSQPDCFFSDPTGPPAIPSQRDLEDYARLWMPGFSNMMANIPTNYSVNLLWRNNTGAEIRLFKAAENNGGTNYLFDTNTAAAQTNFSLNPCYGYVSANHPLDVGTEYRTWGSYAPTNDHYIFCGCSSGNDELVLKVINPYGGVVGEASVFFNLKDIKQMYERWILGNDYDYTQSIPNIAAPAADNLPSGTGSFKYAYDSSLNSALPYILFVHGWNMEPWEKDRYAETAYKRLYWQGYQGRFGLFRWPTGFDFSGVISTLTDSGNYDLSEYDAWQSSVGLENRLNALNIQYPENAYVMAHSMGNIVTGEALRLAGTTLANTYVAMEGAVPAHCYDQTATFRTIPLFYDSGTPDRYANYPTNDEPCYFSGVAGAAKYINFFNASDWALGYWTTDQDFKPDSLHGYNYNSTNSEFTYGTIEAPTILGFPTNTYQIFSFCDEARCYAIGAQPNLGGAFLTDFQVNLAAPPYNFGAAHKFHSGQFRSDNMDRAVFWNQLLIQMNLDQ